MSVERTLTPDPECVHHPYMPKLTAALADPVGAVEIADRLKVQRATVDQWRARGIFPDPRWTVGGRPAWDWSDVDAWAEATGRRPAGP